MAAGQALRVIVLSRASIKTRNNSTTCPPTLPVVPARMYKRSDDWMLAVSLTEQFDLAGLFASVPVIKSVLENLFDIKARQPRPETFQTSIHEELVTRCPPGAHAVS